MPKIARLNYATTGICRVHGSRPGTITAVNAIKTEVEGILVACTGDTVTASCGHIGIIDPAAPTTNAEGKQVARLGDSFSGIYTGTITGSASNSVAGNS